MGTDSGDPPLVRRSSRAFRVAAMLELVALAILVGGCGESTDDVEEVEEGRLVLGLSEEQQIVERGVAPGDRPLVLEGYYGNINLTATAGPFAVLEFVKTARGEDADAARRRLDEVDILEQGTDEEFRYVLQTAETRLTAVNVNGSVPERTAMHIHWESGTIRLSGHDGPLQVTNGSGNVEAAGVAGSAEIRVNNGAILLGVVDLPTGSSIVLETSNGDITVSLPDNVSAQIAAQTAAGAIRTNGLSFEDRHLEPLGAGAEFSGRLRRGNANIRLRTENGTIHLQEGRMDRLPSSDTLAVPADTSGLTAPDTTDLSTTADPADTTTNPAYNRNPAAPRSTDAVQADPQD